MLFQPKTKQELLDYLSTFNPKKYASSRNFINGQVSYLSPYLTHGVITLQECVEVILSKYTIKDAEKFLMELIRKEFFMQVQMNYGNSFTDTPVREDKT
jgi:deoxyribodipyrimidine photo-lyase